MAVVKLLSAVADSLNVQAFLIFAAVLLLTVAWLRRRPRPGNLPPGPRPWPFLGNIRELQRGPLRLLCGDWARQYGSIVSIWMGPRLAIVLNDIDVVKEALVGQADCFSDRPMERMGAKGGIVMANGHVWKERRRFGLTAMRNLGMGKRSVEHRINEEARHLLESFDGKGEKPFDPEHAVTNAVSNIICTISFGYRFEYSDPKFAYLMESVKTTLQTSSFATGGGSILKLLSFFFRRSTLEEKKKQNRKIIDFIQQIVQEHRETFDPNDLRDVIDMYLLEINQHDEIETGEQEVAFSEKTMWRIIYDLFIAGTDTTTNTLMWLLLFMATHSEVQERVQREIDDVIGCDRQPTNEDRGDMPYTNAVLMEMQRFRPVTPNGVPHRAEHHTELRGYTIPAKTIVFFNLWNILHDPKYWKDPEKFDPTRFLSKDGKTVQRPEAFIPFGTGKRACLGETLAKMEMFLFFVSLLQRFTFSLPAGKPRPSLEGVGDVTMGPHRYEIVARKR